MGDEPISCAIGGWAQVGGDHGRDQFVPGDQLKLIDPLTNVLSRLAELLSQGDSPDLNL